MISFKRRDGNVVVTDSVELDGTTLSDVVITYPSV
jgi:hypothetical protein